MTSLSSLCLCPRASHGPADRERAKASPLSRAQKQRPCLLDRSDETDERVRHQRKPDGGLGRRERADRDVISIGVSKRELHRPGARVQMRLLFKFTDESACSRQSNVEVIDTEKQEQTVARRRRNGAHQRGMLVCA